MEVGSCLWGVLLVVHHSGTHNRKGKKELGHSLIITRAGEESTKEQVEMSFLMS
jgi:hypothetical protein